MVAFFCLLGVLGNFAGGGVAGFLGGFGVFFLLGHCRMLASVSFPTM